MYQKSNPIVEKIATLIMEHFDGIGYIKPYMGLAEKFTKKPNRLFFQQNQTFLLQNSKKEIMCGSKKRTGSWLMLDRFPF